MLEEHWLYCIISYPTPPVVGLGRAPPGVSKWVARVALTCAYKGALRRCSKPVEP